MTQATPGTSAVSFRVAEIVLVTSSSVALPWSGLHTILAVAAVNPSELGSCSRSSCALADSVSGSEKELLNCPPKLAAAMTIAAAKPIHVRIAVLG